MMPATRGRRCEARTGGMVEGGAIHPSIAEEVGGKSRKKIVVKRGSMGWKSRKTVALCRRGRHAYRNRKTAFDLGLVLSYRRGARGRAQRAAHGGQEHAS